MTAEGQFPDEEIVSKRVVNEILRASVRECRVSKLSLARIVKAMALDAHPDFNRVPPLNGRIDVVVSSLGESPELWQNITPGENSWLILKLEGTRSNRDGIGAEIHLDGQVNQMTSAMSYASSSHFGAHFGTGKLKQLDKIEIRWPSGTRQVIRNVRTNQVLRIREP